MTTDWPAEKAAFVTGAASGLGLGISRALVAAGAKVALADIDADRLARVAKEITDAGGTVFAVPLDVSDADQWATAADRAEGELGPISILCNVAGVAGMGVIGETTLDSWRWVFKINTEAQFVSVSTFLPRFKSRGGRAHILNVTSMAGLVPMANVASYCSSKAASVLFSRVLQLELQGTDIGVSLMCPGTMQTRIARTSAEGEAQLLGHELRPEAVDANSAMLTEGADPDDVGRQVLKAMQDRDPIIVTHGEWETLVDREYAAIKHAFRLADGLYGPDVSARMLAEGSQPVSY